MSGVAKSSSTSQSSTIRTAFLGLLLGWVPAFAFAQSTDLVANNSGPSTSAAGAPFTYVVTLSNNGPSAADGATFSDTMPSGASGVTAVCTGASGGAVCPSGAGLVATNSQVTGSIPTLPNQGAVQITISGSFGVPSPTSVSSTVTLDPPAGVGEIKPGTNSSQVNTTISNDANVRVRKSATTAGDVTTYTISITNDGSASADGTYITDYLRGDSGAAGNAAVQSTFVSCTATGAAQCPSDSKFPNRSYPAWPGYPRYLIDSGNNAAITKFPPGTTVTVVYQLVVTPNTAKCGLAASNLINRVELTLPAGITSTSNALTSEASTPVAGTADCPPARDWNYGFTKTQSYSDGTPVAQNEPVPFGTPIVYTLTIRNNESQAADGAMLRDWINGTPYDSSAYHAGVKTRLVSCTASGGAQCPASFPTYDRSSPAFNSNYELFNLSIPRFPAGSAVTVAYEVLLSQPLSCGLPSGSFQNYAHMAPPAGASGYNPKQLGPVQVALPATPACPDLQIIKTQSTSVPQAGVPFDYQVTIVNNGPGAADGAIWNDSMRGTLAASGLVVDAQYISCTGSNGAECPADDRFRSFNSVALNGSSGGVDLPSDLIRKGTVIPRLPAGGMLTLTHRVTPQKLNYERCFAASGTIYNEASVTPHDGLSPTTRKASTTLPISCADLGITKAVDPVFAQAGQPITYTVTVSNAGLSAVADAVFSDPLPANFNYQSATCTTVRESSPPLPHPRTECGAAVEYDPTTRLLKSTIKSLGQQGEIQFTIRGTAGAMPGTYKNEAFATVPAGVFDPNLSTNRTDVNVQIANTQSPITVKKSVAGLPASGLPADTRFSGLVTCGTQPAQAWSVTVPRGSTSGTSTPLRFYDTESCTVTEDTPPAAPAGYEWVGAPTIGNTSAPLGPETPREVSVTNTLKRQMGSLALTKLISGTQAGQVNGRFAFAIDCGADGTFNAEVTIANGASSTATLGNLPSAASCRVSETSAATAPAGSTWDSPVYDTNPVVIPAAGGTATFRVTNVLKTSAPVDPAKIPAMGGVLLAVTSALVALLGALFARHRRPRSA